MPHTYRNAWAALILITTLLLLTTGRPAHAAPELTIGDYQLVSSARISRTVSEYTYKAAVINTGSDALDVSATLNINAPGVTVLDGELSFGDVGAGATVVSSDTFVIRHDRTHSFNESQLTWRITAAQASGPPLEPRLRLLGVNPSSAAPGAMVEISYDTENLDASNLRIVLKEEELVPETIVFGRLGFRVPDDLKSENTLFLRSGQVESNTLVFTVSETISVLSPSEDDIITLEEDGSRVAVNLVMIFVQEGFDLDAVADAAASTEGGEVVGRIDPLRARQLRLPTTTYEQLNAAITRLKTHSGVKNVIMDVELPPELISLSWANDPDLPDQRASNRVEQGAQAYINNMHPTVSGYLKPFFQSLGIFEDGVHFNLADYSGYASRGGARSNGVALYAPDSAAAEHGSNVVGLIAAELDPSRPPQNHAGSAGLLNAIGTAGSNGGFNISVNSLRLGSFLADTTSLLNRGVRLFNLSTGLHRCDSFNFLGLGNRCTVGLLQSNGQTVTNNPRRSDNFNSIRDGYDELIRLMERDYPDAILVVSAGNGNTDAGDRAGRLFSSHPSKQVIVVGAHSNNSVNPVRDQPVSQHYPNNAYSNYGERVDISAAGSVKASMLPSEFRTEQDYGQFCLRACSSNTQCLSECLARTEFVLTGTSGTSFATPLVTATIAAMRSIGPDLTPSEVLDILRSTALPIHDNVVNLFNSAGSSRGCTVFVRPLTDEVDGDGCRSGPGARLNVEGAINAAIAKRANRTRREGDEVNVTITGKETVTKDVNVTIPFDGTVFDRVDIMFLVDVSGSYGSSINQFKNQAAALVNAFKASGTDVHTGIASFSDFPIGPWGTSGDYAFRLDQALTSDGSATIGAINRLALKNGNDTPESQLEALYQLATGFGRTVSGYSQATISPTTIGWREGALRIIFLATDANFHNPETGSSRHTPGYPGASWSTTLEALKSRGIRVYGLERGFQVADVRRIVNETKGETFQLDFSSSNIVSAVLAALKNAAEKMDIKLVPNGDFAGIIQKIEPDIIKDVARGETKTFTVTLARGNGGAGEHVFVFRLEVVGAGTAVIEEIPVVIQLK